MINGYDKVTSPEGPHYESRVVRSTPAASLSNLGNTCFLNSVLYTLRFAPNFLHNLHHLVNDMNLNTANNSQVKVSKMKFVFYFLQLKYFFFFYIAKDFVARSKHES